MVSSQVESELELFNTPSRKRRLRRQKLRAAKNIENNKKKDVTETTSFLKSEIDKSHVKYSDIGLNKSIVCNTQLIFNSENMSSKESKSREEIVAAREAKKTAKLKTKKTDNSVTKVNTTNLEEKKSSNQVAKIIESKDETDKAVLLNEVRNDKAVLLNEAKIDADKTLIKAERAAKKAAKQSKKKVVINEEVIPVKELNVQAVVKTLNDIELIARDVKDSSVKVNALNLENKKPEDLSKNKAELRAERRAKQEAQRASKQNVQLKTAAVKPDSKSEPKDSIKGVVIKKPIKIKNVEKSKQKAQDSNRMSLFQHLYNDQNKEASRVAINSQIHPAIIRLGIQLSSKVVAGSNARCIALLNALKKMITDYTLPAKTEFARGLESALASSLDYLWSMRPPSASQTNAVKFFRHQLNQLQNNVEENVAKEKLKAEIDRYISEQIDKAGEAISLTMKNKIVDGDTILTYGCSSLVERILKDAIIAKKRFRAVVVGSRALPAGTEMLRRLREAKVPCTYADITALSFLMKHISKVLLGAGALLVNGSVLAAVGSAQTALVAHSYNVPVLYACETHKFSERVLTDAVVYNEIGDPDDLIDRSDEHSPLKDWRSNPNLTPLNLTYDVTPPELITAVVTELAILPCTSAPVVLRFKATEYGM